MMRRWWVFLLLSLAVLGLAWAMQATVDAGWSERLRLSDEHWLEPWSERIGVWGDFAQYNFAVVGLLLVLARVFGDERFRRAAVAAFLSAVMAGVICNEFRFAVGRPRPAAERVDEVHGPTGSSSFHGFPSGHTAVAFGTSVPVLVACPPVGAVLMGVSATVGWARMADGVHYPSDVWTGMWIGTAFGLACGMGARRLGGS